LKIGYKSGKKEKFYYIGSREFKKLKTIQPQFMEIHEPSKAMERHFLCPKCVTPLPRNIFFCPNCDLEFKNIKDAIKRSILFPGGGYFYARHPILGTMDAITEGVLWIVLVTRVVEVLGGIESWGPVLYVGVILFLKKWITVYHSKNYINEYIPIDRNIGMASLNPSPDPFSPYKPPQGHKEQKRLKLTLAIVLLIFSMSFLGWKLYPHLAYRDQGSAPATLREVPEDPQKERVLSKFLEEKYTRIDDDKWGPVLYQNKDFDAVEKHISGLLGQSEDEAKTYELDRLYGLLGDVKDDKDIELKKGVLDEWCARRPDSHIPWLVRGNFYIEYAWHVRGAGRGKEFDKEAWPKCQAMLEQAEKDLEKSWQLNPKDPNSSSDLIVIAIGQGYPKDKMEQYFRNATSVCPWHFGAHANKLDYLKPKWHGSSEEMYDFAKDCLGIAERYPYLGLIMVNALVEIHYFIAKDEDYLGKGEIWTMVEKIYNNFFSKYPQDIRRRFYYAYYAYTAKKYDLAMKQFEIIGDRWMENTCWRSLKQYNRCRAFAYSAHAVTLPPKQAVEYLKKSIEVDPTERISFFNLGGFSRMMGEHEEAEKAFLRVVELDPQEGKAYLQLSRMYWRDKNDLVKAKEYAEKALTCDLTREEKREARECIRICSKILKQ
jgi:tetratricopeptide (TPR) repeat protein